VARFSASRSSWSRSGIEFAPPLASERSTIFSPKRVGTVEARNSIGPAGSASDRRPSWGLRRSVMFMPAMSFMRDMIRGWMSLSRLMRSRNFPSMRKRTCVQVSWGSMWRSLTRSCTASSSIVSTIPTISEDSASSRRLFSLASFGAGR